MNRQGTHVPPVAIEPIPYHVTGGRLQDFHDGQRANAIKPVAPRRFYLDHNATAPMRPDVLDAMRDALAAFGNPSAVHREGRAARARVERAREQVAALVGADPAGVIFTSGGTEANNTALRPGALRGHDGREAARLLVGATEHASVRVGHRFPDATVLPVGQDGTVAPSNLLASLAAEAPPALVSVQLANSETGIRQPIAALAEAVRAAGSCFHTDAVGAAGRVPIEMAALRIDALSLAGHKFGGPPGAGALIVAPGRTGTALALLRGGAQEGRRRAGTENVPAIVGLGVAAACAARDLSDAETRLTALRDAAEAAIRRIAPDATIFGAGSERMPHVLAFAVAGLAADTALMALDLDGVAVSSGSACSSGKVERSPVLLAMGVDPALATGAIRLSFGWSSDREDVAAFARAFESIVQRLYERRAQRAA